MIFIRQATTKDARSICQIQQKTWIATYESKEENISKHDLKEYTKEWTKPRNIEYFKEMIIMPNQIWMVAESKKRVVGHIRFLLKENYGEIDMLYVLPEYQRMGIGNKLLSEATKNHNIDIVVDVIHFNRNAITFYKKQGFIFLKRESNSAPPLPSGKKMELIRMKKLAN